MRRRLFISLGLILGILLTLPVMTPVNAQEEKEKKKEPVKQDRIDGTIQMMDKNTKTITVRQRGQTVTREVIYDDNTKFTYRNKTGSFDDVKEGRRVIALGKHNDKRQLVATRIDVRDQR